MSSGALAKLQPGPLGCTVPALGRAGLSPRVGARVAPSARPEGFVTPSFAPRFQAGVDSAPITARRRRLLSAQTRRHPPDAAAAVECAAPNAAPSRAAKELLMVMLENKAN